MKSKNQHFDVYLDGSTGEGGGQILRSALSLSAITGKSFRLDRIRAGRKRPGLMRQHLTCVKAAAEICGAATNEVSIGSEHLTFEPGEIEASSATFSIGTAGSTSLLLQTILPILLYAKDSSNVTLQGGTHVIKSPCFEYIDEIFLPQLRRIGGFAKIGLARAGFFPAGGGEVKLNVSPSRLSPLEIHDRNPDPLVTGEVLSTPEIPDHVPKKELRRVDSQISLHKASETRIEAGPCPGNVLLLRASAEPKSCPGTLVSVCGEKNKRSEQVSREAVRWMKRYLNSSAPVDEHLADQLLLPLALAGGGGFTTARLTPHFHSNIEVIQSFLPIKISTEQLDRFSWKVKLASN